MTLVNNKKMKVEPMAILRYKIHKWVKLTEHKILWGIDVVIDGKSYHVKNDEAIFFDAKNEAVRYVRKLNKELRDKRSVATDDAILTNPDNQTPNQ